MLFIEQILFKEFVIMQYMHYIYHALIIYMYVFFLIGAARNINLCHSASEVEINIIIKK